MSLRDRPSESQSIAVIKIASLEDSIKAVEVKLSEQQVEKIDAQLTQ